MVLRCSSHHGCTDGTYSLQTRNDGASVAGDVLGVKVHDSTVLHLFPQQLSNLLKCFVSVEPVAVVHVCYS